MYKTTTQTYPTDKRHKQMYQKIFHKSIAALSTFLINVAFCVGKCSVNYLTYECFTAEMHLINQTSSLSAELLTELFLKMYKLKMKILVYSYIALFTHSEKNQFVAVGRPYRIFPSGFYKKPVSLWNSSLTILSSVTCVSTVICIDDRQ